MKSIITGMLVAGVLTILPAMTFASTYEYVNTSGGLSSLTANSATEALEAVSSMGSNSGVMLISGNNEVSTYNPNQVNQYIYVNSSGVVTTISANTPTQAFASATNIAVHSGVMDVNSTSDQSLVGNSLTVYGN